jgi:hypothetical protein
MQTLWNQLCWHTCGSNTSTYLPHKSLILRTDISHLRATMSWETLWDQLTENRFYTYPKALLYEIDETIQQLFRCKAEMARLLQCRLYIHWPGAKQIFWSRQIAEAWAHEVETSWIHFEDADQLFIDMRLSLGCFNTRDYESERSQVKEFFGKSGEAAARKKLEPLTENAYTVSWNPEMLLRFLAHTTDDAKRYFQKTEEQYADQFPYVQVCV